MEEVRQLVQEEGREARNVVAFHVPVDNPARVSRKPPRSLPAPLPRRAAPRAPPRLRSASAGRDKRSELRARYWALLFGDLQRSVGEIYNTVESHESLSECQEVILVLENYTRDFKALGEWFRLKWEYDNTPPPQRPQSLAWEIRKTDFVRPESRKAHSVRTSPSVSGKNSPCLSGHNTPSGKNSPNLLSGKTSPGSGKISPRINTSPKGNVEFFSNKIAAKITTKPEPKAAKESRLSDIKEKFVLNVPEVMESVAEDSEGKVPVEETFVEVGKAKEIANICPKQVVIKSSPKHGKYDVQKKDSVDDLSSVARATIAKLNAMECSFLEKQLIENAAKNDNMLNFERAESLKAQEEVNDTPGTKTSQENENSETDKIIPAKSSSESPTLSEDNFADVSNESSQNEDKNGSSIDEKTNPTNTPSPDHKAVGDESAKLTFVNGIKNNLSVDEKTIEIKTEIPKKETKSQAEPKAKEKDITGFAKNTKKEEKIAPVTKTNTKIAATAKKIEKTTPSTTEKKPPDDITNKTDTTEPKAGPSSIKEEPKDHEFKKPEPKSIDNKVNTRPAYSQAAAKPKLVTTTKVEVKPVVKTTPIMRSKTVVEMRSTTAQKAQKPLPKRNQTPSNSRCSYPFNLTTGRNSLFDNTNLTPPVKPKVNKPLPRNTPMAAGDNKGKVDTKKVPPKPPASLNINGLGDNASAKPQIEKPNDFKDTGSSETIANQEDMNRIDSSESLKTLVPDDATNSLELLNVDVNKTDEDGWLTVKSRRFSRESKKQSKSHWSNRFNQPSATTSLPTLNMIESPTQESKPIVETPKVDRAKSEQPSNVDPVVTVEKSVKVNTKPKAEKPKNTVILRQKSDVTGLKTRSARNKSFTKKNERTKDSKKPNGGNELSKNRLHSSLESLSGLSRSQESTEDPFDFDKWKEEFKSYFKYEDEDDEDQNEILKSADPSEMNEIAEMTSQIEENERKISLALDFQSEYDQRKLSEEEDLLNRQIMELQEVSDVDIDTETDDTETDADIPLPADVIQECASNLEEQYSEALEGMTRAERLDTLKTLEALVARDPGRAQQLHAKLSQNIKRRGSFQETLRRLQAKQARAEKHRLDLQTERSKKIHSLLTRVEEVKVAKNQLIEEKRMRMERRLQKAAENRDQHLKDIVRKAHDEEEKLREIAFIKQLEAENRRHDFLHQCRAHTTRLRRVRRERLHKLEQKAAREAAVNARRLALEEARRQHVTTLVERRRERETRAEELKELKSKEREEAAREKAEGYKTRKAALDALAEQEVDALRSRIQCKQEASEQRLEKHLQAIRTKATAPRVPTTSETQEQPTTEEDLIKKRIEENRERERQRNMRKRARKIRQKLLDAGREFEEMNAEDVEPLDYYSSMPETNRVYRCLTVINNTIEHLVPMEFRINNNKNEQKNEEAQTNKDNKENEKGNNQKGAKNQEENKNQQVNKNNKKKNKLVRKDSDEQFRTINNECKQGSLCIKTYEQNHRPENVRTEYSVASQKKKKKKNNAQQALVNGTEKSENETATDNSDPTSVEKTGENSSKAGNSEPKTNGIAGTSKQSDEPDGDKKSNKKKKKPSDGNDNDDNTNTVTNGIAETQTTTNNANGPTNEGSSSTNGPNASMAKGKKGKGKGKQTNTNAVNSNTNGVNSNTNAGNSNTNEPSSKTNEVTNTTNGDTTSSNNESSSSTNGVTSSTGAIPKVPVAKKSKGKQKQSNTNEVTSNKNGAHFKSNEASTNSKKFKGKNDWQLTNGFDEPKSGKNNRKNNRNTNAKDYQRPSTSRQDQNDSFLRKLSKESSLASSISDLSKISSKSERRRKERELQMAFDYVDWKALEKHVNELHIAVSRLDKEHQDILLNGLEVLSYILVIALMPESQGKITTKTLTVAVQMIGAVISACPMAAGFFLCTNNCVHQVTLLSVVLQERDLSDRQTLELAKQLCDCLSICVDAVLCGTRLLASSGDGERAHVACMRARAHPLILYICLSGCVTAITDKSPARDGVQALLTVCVEVCHPCEVDDVTCQDRQLALEALRASLTGGMAGCRNELCSLFATGCDLHDPAEFVRAARTAHMLCAAAKLDYITLQESFGEGRWPLEFRAAVARLLSQHAPRDQEEPRENDKHLTHKRLDKTLVETMVLDLIIIVGFVIVNNPQLQETICKDWSMVRHLCTLPASWLVTTPHCKVLLPTLAVLAQHPPNVEIMEAELSMELIEEYIMSEDAAHIKLVQVIKEGRKKKLKELEQKLKEELERQLELERERELAAMESVDPAAQNEAMGSVDPVSQNAAMDTVDPVAQNSASVDPVAQNSASVDPAAQNGAMDVDPVAQDGAMDVDPGAQNGAMGSVVPVPQNTMDPPTNDLQDSTDAAPDPALKECNSLSHEL